MDYLRVTEIISPFTGVEFVPFEILDKACERGTLVHEIIESKFDALSITEIPVHVSGYIKSFEQYVDEIDFSTLDFTKERRFYCEKTGITGQIDMIINVDGKRFILDWKTSARESLSWKLQAAAYQYLCSVNGIEIDHMTFVKLCKKGGKPKTFTYDTYEHDLDIFFKCLELYKFFDMKNTRRSCG